MSTDTPSRLARCLQALRLMVGIGDYGRYLEHCRRHHPGEPVLDRDAYLRHCMEKRYGGGKGQPGKCPC